MIEGSDERGLIRWYFADDDANLLPFPTAFGSQVWEYLERDLVGPGEADRVRSFDPGHNPGYLGKAFQGKPEWFINGLPPAELLNPPPALICGRFNLWATGGALVDGQATMAFSAGMAAAGGTLLGGSAFGMFQLTAKGGVVLDSAAGFDGPIDLAGTGGVMLDVSTFLEDIPGDEP